MKNNNNHNHKPTAAAAAAKLCQSCPTLCDPVDPLRQHKWERSTQGCSFLHELTITLSVLEPSLTLADDCMLSSSLEPLQSSMA